MRSTHYTYMQECMYSMQQCVAIYPPVNPMPRRTKEEALQTRESIIEAAAVLFHDKGVSSTSLNDIANEAGVTRGAVYWHFKNKGDIFEEIVDRVIAPLNVFHDQIEDPNEPDPLGRFRALMDFLMQELAHNPTLRRGFTIAFLKCEQTDENAAMVAQHRRNFLNGSERISKALENAIAHQQLPADLNIEYAVVQLHVQLTGLIYLWLLMPDVCNFERASAHILDVYFAGLRQNFL